MARRAPGGPRLSPALTPASGAASAALPGCGDTTSTLTLLALSACPVSTAETDDGRLIDDDPKSRAGIRMVSFPRDIVPELRWHLECFAQAADDGLVFIGPLGGRLRRKNSASSGSGRETPEGCLTCTSMICATPVTRWRGTRRGDRGGHGQAAERCEKDGQAVRPIGHAAGTQPETRLMTITNGALITPPTWAGTTGAGDGNRTRMTSLEGVWRTAVKAAELAVSMPVSSRN